MNVQETARWVRRWWQENGLRAQGEVGLDGATLSVTEDADENEVRAVLRLDVPPDLVRFVEELVVLRPVREPDDPARADRARREQVERVTGALYEAMGKLRGRAEEATAEAQTPRVGPVGTGPVAQKSP